MGQMEQEVQADSRQELEWRCSVFLVQRFSSFRTATPKYSSLPLSFSASSLLIASGLV